MVNGGGGGGGVEFYLWNSVVLVVLGQVLCGACCLWASCLWGELSVICTCAPNFYILGLLNRRLYH